MKSFINGIVDFLGGAIDFFTGLYINAVYIIIYLSVVITLVK